MNAVRQLRSRISGKYERLQRAGEGDTKGKSAAFEHSSPLHCTNKFNQNNKLSEKSIRMFSYLAPPYGAVFVLSNCIIVYN